MKDTERLRLLYQDSEAFKAGIEVGRKEAIEKACEWLSAYFESLNDDLVPEPRGCTEGHIDKIKMLRKEFANRQLYSFRKAMEEQL